MNVPVLGYAWISSYFKYLLYELLQVCIRYRHLPIHSRIPSCGGRLTFAWHSYFLPLNTFFFFVYIKLKKDPFSPLPSERAARYPGMYSSSSSPPLPRAAPGMFQREHTPCSYPPSRRARRGEYKQRTREFAFSSTLRVGLDLGDCQGRGEEEGRTQPRREAGSVSLQERLVLCWTEGLVEHVYTWGRRPVSRRLLYSHNCDRAIR